MSSNIQIHAEDVIGVKVATTQTAQAIASQLRASGLYREVVVGLDSVAVQFAADQMTPEEVIGALNQISARANNIEAADGPLVDIPAIYGGKAGPDLSAICDQLALSENDFIERHSAATYRADMIGFTPGFAYLSGLDAKLNVARRATPRPRVPAGSIGISGAYCGLYALPGPGGWPLIARTETTLFDAHADDPFLIHPGTRIRFAPQ